MTIKLVTEKKGRSHNSPYPKGAVSCSKDNLWLIIRHGGFQTKYCDKSPAL